MSEMCQRGRAFRNGCRCGKSARVDAPFLLRGRRHCEVLLLALLSLQIKQSHIFPTVFGIYLASKSPLLLGHLQPTLPDSRLGLGRGRGRGRRRRRRRHRSKSHSSLAEQEHPTQVIFFQLGGGAAGGKLFVLSLNSDPRRNISSLVVLDGGSHHAYARKRSQGCQGQRGAQRQRGGARMDGR